MTFRFVARPELLAFDVFIHNVDRRARNPNVLTSLSRMADVFVRAFLRVEAPASLWSRELPEELLGSRFHQALRRHVRSPPSFQVPATPIEKA